MSATVLGLGLLLTLGAQCGGTADDTAASTTPDDEYRVGLRHFEGQATLSDDLDAYEGWEAFRFTAEQGLGEDLCQIRYTMAHTAPRMDCADCLWAFDLVSSSAAIESESGDGCTGLGMVVSEFDGLAYSYGFAATSGAYQDVLMYQVGSYGWYPVSYAGWTEPRFRYDWEMGLYYY